MTRAIWKPNERGQQRRPLPRIASSLQNSALFFVTALILIAIETKSSSAYKTQAEDECSLASIVLCYECNSRTDPNCADPFNFTALAAYEAPSVVEQMSNNALELAHQAQINSASNCSDKGQASNKSSEASTPPSANLSTLNQALITPKKMPPIALCRGCCVKITSKLPDGTPYVKRTCTTNLQINYFMVGLVCMKESGDRGKMCFCETDYCNGQPKTSEPLNITAILIVACLIDLSIAYLVRR